MEHQFEQKFTHGDLLIQRAGLSIPADIQTQKVINSTISIPITHTISSTAASIATNYGVIFTADKSYIFESVALFYGTAASAGTLQLEKLDGSEAQGSGDDLLDSQFSFTGAAPTAIIKNISPDGGVTSASSRLVF